MKNKKRDYEELRFDEHPPCMGGTTKIHSGYIFEFLPGHHLQNYWGWVAQHRLIAEKKTGRKLRRGEVVHHVDGNPLNNDPENLRIMLKSEHHRLHALENARKMKIPLTHKQVKDALQKEGGIKPAARALDCDHNTLRNRFRDLCLPYQRRIPTKIDDPEAIALVLKYAPDPKVGLREVVQMTGMSAMTAMRIAQRNGIKWVKKSRKGEKRRTYRGVPIVRT